MIAIHINRRESRTIAIHITVNGAININAITNDNMATNDNAIINYNGRNP